MARIPCRHIGTAQHQRKTLFARDGEKALGQRGSDALSGIFIGHLGMEQDVMPVLVAAIDADRHGIAFDSQFKAVLGGIVADLRGMSHAKQRAQQHYGCRQTQRQGKAPMRHHQRAHGGPGKDAGDSGNAARQVGPMPACQRGISGNPGQRQGQHCSGQIGHFQHADRRIAKAHGQRRQCDDRIDPGRCQQSASPRQRQQSAFHHRRPGQPLAQRPLPQMRADAPRHQRADQKGKQRHQIGLDGKTRRARRGKAQKDDIARHIGRKHLAKPQHRDGINKAGGGREQQEQAGKGRSGFRHGRSSLKAEIGLKADHGGGAGQARFAQESAGGENRKRSAQLQFGRRLPCQCRLAAAADEARMAKAGAADQIARNIIDAIAPRIAPESHGGETGRNLARETGGKARGVERAKMAVAGMAVAADDIGAQGQIGRARRLGKGQADLAAQCPCADALSGEMAELGDAFDIPVQAAARAMAAQADGMAQFLARDPAETGVAVAIGQIIDIPSRQHRIGAPQSLGGRGTIIEIARSRLDGMQREQADPRAAKAQICPRAIESQRRIGTIAGAHQPLCTQRHHLPPAAQRDRPEIRLGKGLKQVEAALIDRAGGGFDPGGECGHGLHEGAKLARMQ
ncbi:hypothetical protein E4T56_gene16427, partial [Termitomyces sp. T112]